MGKGRAKSRRKEREMRGCRHGAGEWRREEEEVLQSSFHQLQKKKKKKIKVLFISLPTLSMDSGENN